MNAVVVRRENQAVLLQRFDPQKNDVVRRVLPLAAVTLGRGGKNATTTAGQWAMAVDYGVPWRDLVTMDATPEDLERQLHRVGIWTIDDLRRNPEAAQGAIMAAYGVDFQTLARLATKYTGGFLNE